MGYGGSLADAGQSIGRTGDGGIDGIIKEDKLGLDVVCIQAKRWENTVGRPVVQNFADSMEGYLARKGVLITTARFSKDAFEYVKQIERKIVLKKRHVPSASASFVQDQLAGTRDAQAVDVVAMNDPNLGGPLHQFFRRHAPRLARGSLVRAKVVAR
jgi:hypothetical protein